MGKPVDGTLEWRSLLFNGLNRDLETGTGDGAAEDEQIAVLARWIQGHGARLDVRADVMLCTQGQVCRDLYLIERGWVTLLRSEGTGSDVIIGFRSQGALLGTGALIPRALHPFTIRTRTPVLVWSVLPDVLNDALDTDPTLRRAVLARIAAESSEQVARCGALGCLDAREHLERLLNQFMTHRANVGPARIPLNTGEIAGLLGIDLSHASRLLRAMRREGLIEVNRRGIVVPDPAALQKRAS